MTSKIRKYVKINFQIKNLKILELEFILSQHRVNIDLYPIKLFESSNHSKYFYNYQSVNRKRRMKSGFHLRNRVQS